MNANGPARLPHAEADAAVRGHIDRAEPNGTVRGWCAATAAPFGPRRISILVEGETVLTGVECGLFRKDLLAAGIGDGHHGFTATIPEHLLSPGETCRVTLLDEADGVPVGQPVTITWAPRKAAPAASLEAHIDEITDDGLVVGWCWDSAAPDRRVVLNILADGRLAGSTTAGLFRDDLRGAGKGTGHCGFSFFLPWNLIATRAEIGVTLQDSATSLPVGQRVVLRRPQIETAEQRIGALERQLQLLRAELQAAEARAANAEDSRAAPELFRLVASFFQDLADGKPRDSLASLKTRLDYIAERFPLVALSLPDSPAVTIFVLPIGRIAALHACLAALHRAGADSLARIVVLDEGELEGEDAALLPAIVRNVTILRLRPEETINDALRGATTPFLALLPCHLAVGPGWLDQLLARFTAHDAVAIAGGGVALDGGPPLARALLADPAGGLSAAPARETTEPTRADALDDLGVVIRRTALRDLGGLDLSFSGLPARMLDVCLRARRAGLLVESVPEAIAYAGDGAVSLLDQTSAADLQRLRASCAALRGAPRRGRK